MGFTTGFYDHEAIEAGDTKKGLRRLPASDTGESLILRGWMIPGEAYQALYAALSAKGYRPVTNP